MPGQREVRQRLDHGGVLAGRGRNVDRDRRRRGLRPDDVSRKVLTQMPAAAEEQRHHAHAGDAALRQRSTACARSGSMCSRKRQRHGKVRAACFDVRPEAFEWFGPADVAGTVRKEDHPLVGHVGL